MHGQKEEKTKVLEVSYDLLQQAMEDVVRDRFDYYLDTGSGEVIVISQKVIHDSLAELYTSEPDENLDEDVLLDSAVNTSADLSDEMLDSLERDVSVLLDTMRYIRVPERNSSEAYECMRGFTNSLKDSDLQDDLLKALNGKYSFRKFKQVLITHPAERKRWHSFNAKQMRTIIRSWIEDLGFKPVRKRKEQI